MERNARTLVMLVLRFVCKVYVIEFFLYPGPATFEYIKCMIENLFVLTGSRSTIKRAREKYDISRWPNKKEHIKNLPVFATSSREPQVDLNKEITHPRIVEETDKVIIKVLYNI